LAAPLDVYRRYLGIKQARNRPLNIVELVKNGLPVSAAERLAVHMGVPAEVFFTRCIAQSATPGMRPGEL
jgi:hypothetical protein